MVRVLRADALLTCAFLTGVTCSAQDCVVPLDKSPNCTASVDNKCFSDLQAALDYQANPLLVQIWSDIVLNETARFKPGGTELRTLDLVACEPDLVVSCAKGVNDALILGIDVDESLQGKISGLYNVTLQGFTVSGCAGRALVTNGYHVALRDMRFINNANLETFTESTGNMLVNNAAVVARAWNTTLIERCHFESNGCFINNTSQALGVGGFLEGRVDSRELSYTRSVNIIRDSVFINNSGNWGGAMYLRSTMWLLDNITLSENKAKYGGGVVTLGSVEVNMSTFTKNTAIDTGEADAGQYFSEGGALYVYERLRVRNSTFSYNTAQVGGAISVQNGAAILDGCNFTNNAATGFDGGAVSLFRGELALDACEFTGNTAKMAGGAVRSLYGAQLSVRKCQFRNNTAYMGGAAISSGSPLVMEMSVFEWNVCAQPTTFFYQTAADCNGGAVNTAGNISITNGDFSNNKAAGMGGAIYAGGIATVVNSSLFSNIANDGGAIYTSVANISASKFKFNLAFHNGGGIYIENCRLQTSYMKIVVFEFNWAYTGNGGGIYITGALVTYYSKFLTNFAMLNGGAIASTQYIPNMETEQQVSAVLLNDTLFRGNAASKGGALSADTAKIHTCNFDENKASLDASNTCDRNGGGISCSGNLNLMDCIVVGNVAKVDGGGIYLMGKVIILDTSIGCNGATFGGGISSYINQVVGIDVENTLVGNASMSVDTWMSAFIAEASSPSPPPLSSPSPSSSLTTLPTSLYEQNMTSPHTSPTRTIDYSYTAAQSIDVPSRERDILSTSLPTTANTSLPLFIPTSTPTIKSTSTNSKSTLMEVPIHTDIYTFHNNIFNNYATEKCSLLSSSSANLCIDNPMYSPCSCLDYIPSALSSKLIQNSDGSYTNCNLQKCPQDHYVNDNGCVKCATCGSEGTVLQPCGNYTDTICSCPFGKTGNDCALKCAPNHHCANPNATNTSVEADCEFSVDGSIAIPCLECNEGYYVVEGGLCEACSQCGRNITMIDIADMCSYDQECITALDHASSAVVEFEISLRGGVEKPCGKDHDAVCQCSDGFTGKECGNRCTQPVGAASLFDTYGDGIGVIRCEWNRTDYSWGVGANACFDGFWLDSLALSEVQNFTTCKKWTQCRPGYIQKLFPTSARDRECDIVSNVTVVFRKGSPVLTEEQVKNMSDFYFGISPDGYIRIDSSINGTMITNDSEKGTVSRRDTYTQTNFIGQLSRQNMSLPQTGLRLIRGSIGKNAEPLLSLGITHLILDGTFINIAPPRTSSVTPAGIIAIAIGTSFTLLIIVFAILFRRRYASKQSELKEKMQSMVRYLGKTAGGRANDEEMLLKMQKMVALIDRDSFTILEVIGTGNFGTVHKGVIFFEQQSTVCAIKTLRGQRLKPIGKSGEDFTKEASLMRTLTHPNVVRSFGMCADAPDLYLLLEYCNMGDVRSHLVVVKSAVPLRIKLQIMEQVAAGLEYLHSLHIVHRDVAARNILLQTPTSHNMPPRAKLSDMGLARITDDNHQYMKTSDNTSLPVRWLAPEVLSCFMADEKTDVWSFGITLWEVLSNAQLPYSPMRTQEVLIFLGTPCVVACDKILQPEDCPNCVYNIVRDCLRAQSETRPTFTELVDTTSQVIDSMGPVTEAENDVLAQYSLEMDSKFTWILAKQSRSPTRMPIMSIQSVARLPTSTNTEYCNTSTTTPPEGLSRCMSSPREIEDLYEKGSAMQVSDDEQYENVPYVESREQRSSVGSVGENRDDNLGTNDKSARMDLWVDTSRKNDIVCVSPEVDGNVVAHEFLQLPRHLSQNSGLSLLSADSTARSTTSEDQRRSSLHVEDFYTEIC
eukprot:CFRG3155T1